MEFQEQWFTEWRFKKSYIVGSLLPSHIQTPHRLMQVLWVWYMWGYFATYIVLLHAQATAQFFEMISNWGCFTKHKTHIHQQCIKRTHSYTWFICWVRYRFISPWFSMLFHKHRVTQSATTQVNATHTLLFLLWRHRSWEERLGLIKLTVGRRLMPVCLIAFYRFLGIIMPRTTFNDGWQNRRSR